MRRRQSSQPLLPPCLPGIQEQILDDGHLRLGSLQAELTERALSTRQQVYGVNICENRRAVHLTVRVFGDVGVRKRGVGKERCRGGGSGLHGVGRGGRVLLRVRRPCAIHEGGTPAATGAQFCVQNLKQKTKFRA